jgi:hypothetical protein
LSDRRGSDEADWFSIENARFFHDRFSGQQFVNPQHIRDAVVRKLQLDGGVRSGGPGRNRSRSDGILRAQPLLG